MEGLSTITDRYDYDAWGNEYPIMVSTADNPYRYVGQLGYYTHWMDSSLTDLLHLGVRFYEPGVGRFSQRDPLDLINDYIYAGAVPTGKIDPHGFKPLSWDWLKKSAQCSKKAFETCREKINAQKDYEKCYWSVFAKCMGKAWSVRSCEEYFCWLLPDLPECMGGVNPCDKKKDSAAFCQDCCDIKYYCCMIFNGFTPLGPTKCYNEVHVCYFGCDCR